MEFSAQSVGAKVSTPKSHEIGGEFGREFNRCCGSIGYVSKIDSRSCVEETYPSETTASSIGMTFPPQVIQVAGTILLPKDAMSSTAFLPMT